MTSRRRWPDVDPAPWVTTRDPRPEDAPDIPGVAADLFKRLSAAGWDVRAGYSRGPRRTPKIGVYRPVEAWGVQALDVGGQRVFATCQRFMDTTRAFRVTSAGELVESVAPSGKTGKWAWGTVRLERPHGSVVKITPCSVTELHRTINESIPTLF